MKDRSKIIKEFKAKHRLNFFIDRNGEYHSYGTEEEKLELIKKLNNIKN